MEEVRQLVQEEGREARNLVAFHVAVDTPASTTTTRVATRKPPRAAPVRRAPPRTAARLRSASAGRDKREELRARYWALLFGDLQRAVGEIYNTVEAHENQNECQEVVLVLENYTRDFKALGEWFRLKWEYDNTPPPQRPQSLAWEIRKTDFVRPESRRAYSVKSSPSVSGKNSPCLSGHNTPSGKNSPVTGKNSPGSGKISPRVAQYASTSPKANVEFFSNKIASKIATKPEAKVAKETRLSDIKEKDGKENSEDSVVKSEANVESNVDEQQPAIELGKAKECPNISPNKVVIKSPKHAQTDDKKFDETSIQAKATAAKLDAMESEFLVQHLAENKAKNDNILNQDTEIEKALEDITKVETNPIVEDSKETDSKDANAIQSPVKSEDDFADISDDSSPNNDAKPEEIRPKKSIATKDENQDTSSANLVKDNSQVHGEANGPPNANEKEDQDSKKVDPKGPKPADCKVDIKPARPAYSQAAAKPKAVTAKPEVKPPIRATTPILRSRTIVEIPNNAPKARQQFPKRNQTSKCSYPFNLTTGRTSLFDSKPSAKVANKNVIARPGLASGDNKILPHAQLKVDPKKRQPRPTSLKSDDKGDKKDKSNLTLEKIKDCDEYSSCDTLVTQIDMSRIESSESLKTLVPEELQTIPDIANSIEVLNVQNAKCDEEWLTVKSKRLSRESKKQSKNHWGNRFHQPSATTSLPTLNMLESPKQETNPITQANNAKLDRAKSEQPEKPKPKTKVIKPKEKFKDPAMIRQKSDVTGLKTRSSRNKVTKKSKESKQNGELSKNRLHSSLESLTGLARSQESTEDTFDFDKWKAEFKSTFKCFDDDDQISEHDEILKAADPSEMSEIAEMTSQIEENERKMSLALDFQSDADQRKLCAEEDLLNRQIMELQQVSDIDMDTETDDTETDAEILCEDTNLPPTCQSPENLGALAASLEDQYETALAGMSWAERVDTLVVLEALVARDPGRAQQLHAKLSQGIKRRGSLQDALRRLQAKQARAEKQRIEYQTERAKKIHQLLARVEEVKVAKNQLIEEKRLRLERRLQKAAENRDQHIKCIVRKAHDEEEKLREIAFIKQLEAENRRHDFLDQCRSHTTRLRQMRREQLGKLEQKAAREAAVGARRQAIEAARKLHVENLLEKRKERDARVEELKEQKKQERDDAAREKAEGVKSRLSALAAAAELEATALRSRIRDKQDASQMRLESHLQHIREKATGPRQATTSESQDEKRGEEEEAERIELEKKEREKQKAVKKRARKVKQKLLTTGCEAAFSDENMPIDTVFPASNKMYKVIQQLAQILNPLLVIDNTDKPKFDVNNPNNGIDDDNNKQNKKNKNNSPTNILDDDIKKQNKKNKTTNGMDDDSNKQNKKNKNKSPTNGLDDEINKKNRTNSPPIVIDDDISKQNKKNKNSSQANSIDDEQNNSPTIDIDEEIIKQNKKNKNNKTVNGNENCKSKKLKKQKSDEKFETEAIENNNNNANPEIIIEQEESNANVETAKKKSKKNKTVKEIEARTNERPKLSKTSSVCSSLSDMSKTSCKSEKKTRVVIDTTYFDRQLNELHRMMEKFDKLTRPLPQRSLLDIAKDKCLAQKLQGLKILAQLLAVASEREDLAPQFSAKTLTTAVMIMSRVIGNCAMSAGYLITTNACVHCVKLLAGRLDKDLTADPKELELAKQLADCLSIALDSVLCSTRLYEESKDSRDGDLLSALRGRSHTLISYLCLCGCVTKAERPEAGDARESVHTLLTVCSDLCHPCDADIGSERASATQSLRCALGTSVCGARGEFCMLFARDVEIEQCDGFVRAARTAHLLRAVAELDHHIVQEAFGEGGWPLEFRAAVARLLSQHAPNDRESPRTSVQRIGNQRLDQTLQETLVLDLIVLVGFVVVNNPLLQETICDGWSVIKTLCNLPANWLVSKPHSHALLPTLVALSERPSVHAAIASELSTQMLDEYMQNPDAQKVKLVQVIKQGQAKKTTAKK